MGGRCALPLRAGILLLGMLLAIGGPCRLHAQEAALPTLADSKTSLIDNAIPGKVFRLRLDAAYDLQRPDRAEFFSAQSGPGQRGLGHAERHIDYQELSAYGEHLLLPGLSFFIQKPLRFLNPEFSNDHAGLLDLDAGGKFAFWQDERTTASFQLRTYLPTGNPHQGLGTGHASVEPALLVYRELGARLACNGELRSWFPVGGTDFAGDVLRYGFGLQYAALKGDTITVTPVLECVGWSVVSGKETVLLPTGQTLIQSAAHDTIINLQLGCRIGLGSRCDFYTGYGHAVTGAGWYHELLRIELRVFF